MNEIKIGRFIAELRKEQKLTQKDLAAQLHITDKAVSKWERGLSCPDITLLTSIAAILGVTTGELLNGQRNQSVATEEAEKTLDNASADTEKPAKAKTVSSKKRFAVAFSALLLLGILVCSICDIAISGRFSWSLYPMIATIFAWCVLIPFVRYGSKGLLGSLVVFSVLVIPFLYGIRILVGNPMILSIGISMSLFSIAYLWCVYLVFGKLRRKLLATAISLLMTIPLCVLINLRLAKLLSVSPFDRWDFLSFAIITVISVALFLIDSYRIHKS